MTAIIARTAIANIIAVFPAMIFSSIGLEDFKSQSVVWHKRQLLARQLATGLAIPHGRFSVLSAQSAWHIATMAPKLESRRVDQGRLCPD